MVQTLLGLVEAFGSALAGQERLVVFVVVGSQQVSSFGIGTGDDQGRHAVDVGRHTGSDQLLDSFGGRHENLAAHVAALLDGSQLVFPVHAGGASADHGLHQFVSVQHATKTGFGIGNDRQVVIDVAGVARVGTLGPLDFVGAVEGIVDALDDLRHGVNRVQRLIRVHGGVLVVVGSDLPAGQVDRLDAGLGLLNGLTAGQGAQAVDVGRVVDQIPQLFGAATGQGMLDLERAAETDNVSCGIAALDAFPAGVFSPVFFQGGDLLFASAHCEFLKR